MHVSQQFDAKLFMVSSEKEKLDSATRSEMTLGRVLGLALGNTLTLATTEEKKIAKASKVPMFVWVGYQPRPSSILNHPLVTTASKRARTQKNPTMKLFAFINEI